MISIIDYGMGNLGSIQNMLKRIGCRSNVVASANEIACSQKLILPGVGAFDTAMRRISDSGLRDAMDDAALIRKVPVLGICLGMQLLTSASEEGTLLGLDWISAETVRIPPSDGLKVPHMGWNRVMESNPSKLTSNLGDEPRFYFVHSYCVHVKNEQHSILRATHGVEFDAAIQNGNIYGAQFHPEKSHRYGMALLKNFAEL